MTANDFERALRALMRREPFQPFAVELLDGEHFVVDRADAVGFNAGAAAFLGPDGSIHFFNNEDVRELGGGLTAFVPDHGVRGSCIDLRRKVQF